MLMSRRFNIALTVILGYMASTLLFAAEKDAAKPAPKAKAAADKKSEADKPPVVAVEDPKDVAVPEWKPKLDLTKLPGIVVDNTDAELTGDWIESNHVSPYIGENYVHDGNKDKGERLAKYTPDIPAAGRYAIRVSLHARRDTRRE